MPAPGSVGKRVGEGVARGDKRKVKRNNSVSQQSFLKVSGIPQVEARHLGAILYCFKTRRFSQ